MINKNFCFAQHISEIKKVLITTGMQRRASNMSVYEQQRGLVLLLLFYFIIIIIIIYRIITSILEWLIK